MIKNTLVLAAFSLTLLIGLSGCSNFDNTLAPAENSTVELVGEETALSKPKGDPVALIFESLSGKTALDIVCLRIGLIN